MTPPRVSVCIPTYNGETYLKPCLESVLAQTHGDFEVIVTDDCSSDGTLDILREYSRLDKRIRIIQNEKNLGLVGNWNRCVASSSQEWVKFVFQDDTLEPTCLELMLSAAETPIVFCRRDFLFGPGTDERTERMYRRLPDMRTLLNQDGLITSRMVCQAVLMSEANFFGEPTAALIHKSVFSQFGLFNPDLAQLCDLEYWIRVCTNTGVTYVSDTLASFRYHTSSTSANNHDPDREELVITFDRLLLLHEFAFNPHLLALRKAAKEQTPPIHFDRVFARKAVWTKQTARARSEQGKTSNSNWLNKWNRLERQYPRFGKSFWHIPHIGKEWWSRNIGWRFSSNGA
ncbi:MAG TPA: glycosyltransferase family 2 protein [Burkholderiaceae bacterium]|nr:glycosyltransferase family 2 protein [Burkholderiaceae bacterium]